VRPGVRLEPFIALVCACLLLMDLPIAGAGGYSTNFPMTENPISEGGAWHHLDSTLTVVRTELLGGVHVAHGTQNGSGGFDDSNTYLQGFSLDHVIQGTVWKSSSITSSPNQEVELLLRWSDDNPQRNTQYGPTSADGYEININQNGNYLNIGRFKGPLLATTSLSAPRTGDIFKAQVISNSNGSATITVFWNGVQKLSVTDSNPPRRGNPGMGFYIDAGARNNEFGFSSITASDLGSSTVRAPAAPTNVRIVR
jgi:hypothetical protein